MIAFFSTPVSLQSSVCQSCSDVPAGDAAPEPVRATCSSTLLKMQLSFHYFPHTNLSPNHPLLILKSIDSFMKLFHCLFCSENKTRTGAEIWAEPVNSPAVPDSVFVGRPLCVTLVFSSKGQRYLRVGLAVPLFGSVACLRRMVAEEGKLSLDQVTEHRTSSHICKGF